MIKEVFDFNQRALGVNPKVDLWDGLSAKEVRFLRTASAEESDELLLASIAVDKEGLPVTTREAVIGQIDALIDQAYFAIGGLARMGLTAEQAEACFQAVHQANMTKKLGTTDRGDMGVADAAKPTDWVGPEQAIQRIVFP